MGLIRLILTKSDIGKYGKPKPMSTLPWISCLYSKVNEVCKVSMVQPGDISAVTESYF